MRTNLDVISLVQQIGEIIARNRQKSGFDRNTILRKFSAGQSVFVKGFSSNKKWNWKPGKLVELTGSRMWLGNKTGDDMSTKLSEGTG